MRRSGRRLDNAILVTKRIVPFQLARTAPATRTYIYVYQRELRADPGYVHNASAICPRNMSVDGGKDGRNEGDETTSEGGFSVHGRCMTGLFSLSLSPTIARVKQAHDVEREEGGDEQRLSLIQVRGRIYGSYRT